MGLKLGCSVSTLRKLGLRMRVCHKCRSTTWCYTPVMDPGPVCLDCMELSETNRLNLLAEADRIEREAGRR